MTPTELCKELISRVPKDDPRWASSDQHTRCVRVVLGKTKVARLRFCNTAPPTAGLEIMTNTDYLLDAEITDTAIVQVIYDIVKAVSDREEAEALALEAHRQEEKLRKAEAAVLSLPYLPGIQDNENNEGYCS